MQDERVLTWQDETATAAFAAELAAMPEVRNAYITLHGDLGAGKTTLVRHLLRSLGCRAASRARPMPWWSHTKRCS